MQAVETMYRLLERKPLCLWPAPPRVLLRAFGGEMSIDEFRACVTPLSVLREAEVTGRPVTTIVASGKPRPSAASQPRPISFSDATTKNDALKLKPVRARKTSSIAAAGRKAPKLQQMSLLDAIASASQRESAAAV